MRTTLRALFVRSPYLTLACGAVVLVALWWFAWMTPQNHKLAAARQQSANDQVTAIALRARLSNLGLEADAVKSAKSYLERFSAAIPPNPDAPALVVQVYRLSEQKGVSLQSITDNTVEAGQGGYAEIPITISASGGHDALLSFIAGLYGLARLVTIQSLTLSGSGNLNAPGNAPYTANVTATAYSTALAPATKTAS